MFDLLRKGTFLGLSVAALFAAMPAQADVGPADLYGSATTEGSYAERTITISPDTKSVNVEYGETVRFVMQDGQEVVWTFDGLSDSFPLAAIAGSQSASAGSSGPDGKPIQVYVDQSNNPVTSYGN